MTENLLQKLEEKAMLLLSELEMLRNETQQLKKENTLLKLERESSIRKLQELISALDTLSFNEPTTVSSPLTLHSREEYATA